MIDTKEPKLGDLASDIITDFTGIVVAKTEYFGGVVRYALEPENQGRDGEKPPLESVWFDAPRIQVETADYVSVPGQ